jgi:hypothetical protein
LYFFLFLSFIRVYGQPTEKQVKELSAGVTKSSIQTGAADPEKTAIEKQFLDRARKNIETYRKGDASIIVVDSNGGPVKNVKVEINQVTQDFLFGNLAFEIGGFAPKVPYKVDEFKEKFKALFNFAILPFYWNGYEDRAGTPEWQKNQAALEWCLANGITVKGHPLGWTGPAGTPKWLLKQTP